jgi:threonine/homoserine/homoserine lactone efflux protein
VPLTSIVAFWAVAALLIVIPGPDWAFAISAGLRRHVIPAAAGIVLGYAVMTAVATAGVGVLIASSPAALTALTIAGGVYLIWLGVKTVRHPAGIEAQAGHVPGGVARSTVLQGMAVSGLNPKGLLIFVALLPQFASPAGPWPVPIQMLALGGAFTLTCAVVFLAVGSGALALLRARPGVADAVSRVSGTSMVVLGVVLLAEHTAAM